MYVCNLLESVFFFIFLLFTVSCQLFFLSFFIFPFITYVCISSLVSSHAWRQGTALKNIVAYLAAQKRRVKKNRTANRAEEFEIVGGKWIRQETVKMKGGQINRQQGKLPPCRSRRWKKYRRPKRLGNKKEKPLLPPVILSLVPVEWSICSRSPALFTLLQSRNRAGVQKYRGRSAERYLYLTTAPKKRNQGYRKGNRCVEF